MTYYAPLVSVLVTLVLTFILATSKNAVIVRDVPNERSLHSTPVPRVGGIALVAGVLSGWMLLMQFLAWWVVLPVAGLFALSLLDDMRSLSAGTRLIGHFFAALAAVSGAGISLLWFIPVLLFIVWMTNLYNFMDGSDGLAGGMALFGFGCYGAGAWLGSNEMFALLNFSVAAAALGFLVFNLYPAKVFMGDAGSIPLGFLAAIFGMLGWQAGHWPLWFPLLVFSPFVADTTVTLFKRVRRSERLYEKLLADNEHPLPTPYCKLRITQARWADTVRVQQLVLMGFVMAGYYTSPCLHDRGSLAVSEYQAWHPNYGNDTFTGQRQDFYCNTLRIVQQHPIFGVGTGGFPAAFAQQTLGKDVIQTRNPRNPRNEYLMITVQTGMVVWLFYYIFFTHNGASHRCRTHRSRKMPRADWYWPTW